MSDLLYLRQDIQVEPLFDQWYVWSHLIPPATAARNVTERHLKIMESYVAAPQIHANAVKNPRLAGGPFIDYGGKRVPEIKALGDTTRSRRKDLLELSDALTQVDALLRAEAKGHSLKSLYARLPDSIRGYVELFYDINDNVGFRMIEPLLYRSRFFDKAAQSLTLSVTSGDERPFLLSTPRLPGAGILSVDWRFDDERIDQLFSLKTVPKPWSAIRSTFDVAAAQEQLFRSFFTTEPPPPYKPYSGSGLRWRYFGHACILVETRGISVLFDPVLSYTYESQVSRYTYNDLPAVIDYAVITHNHQDHILFETLLQIRHKVRKFVVPRSAGMSLCDPSVKLTLENVGIKNVIELSEFEKIGLGNECELIGLPFFGEHADLAVSTKLAYLMHMGRHSLLFAADSCNIEPRLYELVEREIGPVSVLFLGMECDGAPLTWLYGPLLFKRPDRAADESRRLAGCDYDEAMDLVNRFQCDHVYVYAMGQEPWLNYVMSIKYTSESRPIVHSNRLVDECRSRMKVAERLFGEKEILIEPAAASAA